MRELAAPWAVPWPSVLPATALDISWSVAQVHRARKTASKDARLMAEVLTLGRV